MAEKKDLKIKEQPLPAATTQQIDKIVPRDISRIREEARKASKTVEIPGAGGVVRVKV